MSGARRITALAALGRPGALLLAAVACGEAEPPDASGMDLDAAPTLSCEVGTLNCRCNVQSACRDELLCVAGKCLATEGEPGSPALPVPSPPAPPLTPFDAGSPRDAAMLDSARSDAAADAGADASSSSS